MEKKKKSRNQYKREKTSKQCLPQKYKVPKKLIMNWNLMDWKYAASARQGNETRYLVARAVTIFCWLFAHENVTLVESA